MGSTERPKRCLQKVQAMLLALISAPPLFLTAVVSTTIQLLQSGTVDPQIVGQHSMSAWRGDKRRWRRSRKRKTELPSGRPLGVARLTMRRQPAGFPEPGAALRALVRLLLYQHSTPMETDLQHAGRTNPTLEPHNCKQTETDGV